MFGGGGLGGGLEGGGSSEHITSESVDVSRVVGCSFQSIWVSGLVGTIRVERTNNESIWKTMDSEQIGDAAGTYFYETGAIYHKFIRIRFTKTLGSGNILIRLFAKEINGNVNEYIILDHTFA